MKPRASYLLPLLALTGGLMLSSSPQEEAPANGGGATLPLRPERKIEFTTDEATWQSVDVSPDGKTILFDLLGDIYEMPIAGGGARLLLGGMAFESQPKYSPDGKSIVFLSDRDGAENVWIAAADGSHPRKLSRETQMIFCSPAWTPDGKNVIATRGSRTVPFLLWMYGVDGGAGKAVPTGREGDGPAPVHNALGAAPSPDGRYIYYAHRAGRVAGSNVGFPLWQIARFDRVNGTEAILTHEQGSGIRPVVSPDGKKLVYGTRHDNRTGLRILDLTTDDDRWLVFPVQRDDQETLLYSSMDLLPGYAFTPDGRDIIASYDGKIHRISVATGESRIVPFTAHVSQDIGPLLNFPERVEDGPVEARLIQGPVESPDGKHLAFSALAHIYVMDLPSGKSRRLTSSEVGEFQPVWSPDSKYLAYVTWTDSGGYVWKARAAGGGAPQRLTDASAYYREPAWSPDGARVVALKAPTRIQRNAQRNIPISQPPDHQDIVWISAEGGRPELVAPANGLRHPQFSDDKDRIYLNSARELISMRFDGGDRSTELKVTAHGVGGRELGPVSEIRVSPDGKSALVVFFMLYTHAFLVPIPAGGPGAPIDVTAAGGLATTLTEKGADYVGWADDGKTITWAVGSSLFRVPAMTPGGPVERIVAKVEAPREKAHGTVVLRGARVITMRGDEILPDADVVITGDRISSVGKTGAATPAGATVLDARGKTILPGFVDTHDHWFHIQRDVLELRNWDLLSTLAYGVTTGRDPQTETNDTFAYQDLADTGQILGPRAFSTGPGIFWSEDLQSEEQALDIVGKYRNFYRTKVMKSYLIGNRRQRQLLLEACKTLHIMPTVEGQEDFKMSLTHIIDGFSGNEHLLSPTPLSRDVIELVAQSGVFYTPTLLVTSNGYEAENYFYAHTVVHDDPKVRRFIPHNILDGKGLRRGWAKDSEYNFPAVAASLAKLVRAGGKICVGSHGQFPGLAFHWEMWAMATGMTPFEVLRSATLYGAQAIGYGQDLGSVETGKLADLVVLERDPLQDIHNTTSIRYVVKNGEIYEGATMDKIWPEHKALPPLWWWRDEP
jgi:Tol biopolymer transport system component